MKFNILVVEDEADIRTLLVSMVEMIFMKHYPFLKLNLSTAANGKEALSIAQSQQQDIILSDIIMPVMNGFEFIEKVRLFDKSVPILVLSALSDENDVNKIMQSGASNYTTKPLNGKLFTAQIKVFVDFYLRRQNKYNHSAVNLFSKNIFKRKTEFLVEREEDLVELWEYLLNGVFEKYKIEKVLQFIYDFELFLIKNSITNSIVLEESVEKYYLTLSEVDKVSEEQLHKSLEKYDFDEDNYKYDGFFISLVISKKEEDISLVVTKKPKKETSESKKEDEEARLNDIRYSIHEKVSPEDFLAELDPTFEDKVEAFLDELSLMSMNIYNLEKDNIEDNKVNLQQIIYYLEDFNDIVLSLGWFNVINRSFDSLNDFLSNIDDEILLNSEKRVLLSKMLQGLVDDLNDWLTTLFIDRDAEDIHYFDASFSENCFAIENTFTTQSEETQNSEYEDDSLEFF